MSLNLETLLQGSKQYETLLAIGQNRIADALKMIPGKPARKKGNFFVLWKKKAATGPALDPAWQVAWEILSDKPAPVGVAPCSSLKEASEDFPEWIRLLCALQHNGRYLHQTEVLLQETLHWLQALIVEIKDKSNGYPRNPIAGYVWMNSATIRTWCDPLVEIFTLQENLLDRANAFNSNARLPAPSWAIIRRPCARI